MIVIISLLEPSCSCQTDGLAVLWYNLFAVSLSIASSDLGGNFLEIPLSGMFTMVLNVFKLSVISLTI